VGLGVERAAEIDGLGDHRIARQVARQRRAVAARAPAVAQDLAPQLEQQRVVELDLGAVGQAA
jgi:hypothetical protein